MSDLDWDLAPTPEPSVSPIAAVSAQERAAIRELMQRLHAGHPEWRAADSLLSGTPLEPDLLASLVASLRTPENGKWRKQALAAWILGVAPLPPEQKHVAVLWEEHVIRYFHSLDSARRPRRAYLRTLPVTAVLTLGSGVLGLHPVALALGVLLINLPMTLLLWPFSAAIDRNRMNQIRGQAATALGRLAFPQTVETLAAAVNDPGPRVQERAIPALIRVLATLSPEHYGRQSSEVLAQLCRLSSHWFGPLAIAVINALGVVGGGSVQPTVERLAKRGKTPEIRAAAQMALPGIEARARQEREAIRLLRPTEAPREPEVLLRPAEQAGSADPALLLRPGYVDSEDSA